MKTNVTTEEIKNNLVNALRGAQSDMVIYWDTQDAANIGPAFRFAGESGPLEFVTWASTGGRITADDVAGYNIADYFGVDGAYKGPDQDGIFPVLA